MSKFRIMIVKKDGKPYAVRAAQVNGRTLLIALNNAGYMNWHDAMKVGEDGLRLPAITEWVVINENITALNRAIKKAGGEPLEGFYWSSSEYTLSSAWYWSFRNDYWYYTNKNYDGHVRCVLAV